MGCGVWGVGLVSFTAEPLSAQSILRVRLQFVPGVYSSRDCIPPIYPESQYQAATNCYLSGKIACLSGMPSQFIDVFTSVLHSSVFRLPSSVSRLRSPDSGLRTSDFRLPTSDFGLPTSDFGLRTSDFGLPSSVSKPQTPHPSPKKRGTRPSRTCPPQWE